VQEEEIDIIFVTHIKRFIQLNLVNVLRKN